MFARQGLQPLRLIGSVSLIPRMTASRLPLHATYTRAMGTDAKSRQSLLSTTNGPVRTEH